MARHGGSVLMERMRAEGDFDLIEPVYFTTSQAGAKAPAFGKAAGPLKDAHDMRELKSLEILISCQGGDYTNEIYPRCAPRAGKAIGSMRRARCACMTMPSSFSIR
jgi:aspartate-semialdehyde dehydrogenase